MSARILLVLSSSAFSLAGCIASNVVATTDRLVAPAVAALAFARAGDIVLDGLYESVDIQGDAAATLRKVYYLFADDGSYTGAALVDDGEFRNFQTLSGRWRLAPEGLVLDDQPPATCEAASGELRITAPTGVLRLRRAKVQG